MKLCTSFTESVLGIYPCSWADEQSLPFCCWVVFHHQKAPQFVFFTHQLMEIWVTSSFGTVMDRAAMNGWVQVFVQTNIFISPDDTLRGHCWVVCEVCVSLYKRHQPVWHVAALFLHSLYRSSNCSASLPTAGIINLLNFSQFSGCVETSHVFISILLRTDDTCLFDVLLYFLNLSV